MSKQYSKYHVRLYDLESLQNGLNEIVNLCGWFAYIYHDKDTFDDNDLSRGIHKGDLKKPHYHFIFSLDSKIRVTPLKVAKWFNIDISNIDLDNLDSDNSPLFNVKNLPLMVQYLTHKNHKDKYQYDFNQILTNDYQTLDTLYYLDYSLSNVSNDLKNDEILNACFDLIYQGVISNSDELLTFLRSKGKLSLYAKNKFLFNELFIINNKFNKNIE